MKWDPSLPGLSHPVTKLDEFLNALAAQVEQLEGTVAEQSAEIAALKKVRA